MTTINFQIRTIKHQINSILKLIANGIKSYIDKLIILEAKLESLQELLKSVTYNLFRKDNSIKQFDNFEDLADAFLSEYGSHPSEPTLKEGNDWYYQGTENKRKRRSKHDTFNEKWNALFADRDWIKANWHEFVMEYLVLMTSRKEHRDFTDGHYVTKTKTGYSMHWKIYKDIGLNNLSANTAYSWTMRNGLRNLAIEGTRMRIELCGDDSGALKNAASVAAQLRAEFIRNN
jgi:hypothetical protein